MSDFHPLLTEHLIQLSPEAYSRAVHHEFLQAASYRTLSHDRLALWLAQDRIYASHAYPHFIGRLIQNIPFSSSDTIDSSKEIFNQLLLKILVLALENIIKEISFFNQTAEKWKLDVSKWKERKATRDYTAEMTNIASSRNIEDGIIFLWAMEKVYLDAWSGVYAGLCASKDINKTVDPTAAASMTFATNWSCPEFKHFVHDLTDLVNSLPISPGSEEWKRAESIWLRVLELEEEFWPSRNEEETMRVLN